MLARIYYYYPYTMPAYTDTTTIVLTLIIATALAYLIYLAIDKYYK